MLLAVVKSKQISRKLVRIRKTTITIEQLAWHLTQQLDKKLSTYLLTIYLKLPTTFYDFTQQRKLQKHVQVLSAEKFSSGHLYGLLCLHMLVVCTCHVMPVGNNHSILLLALQGIVGNLSSGKSALVHRYLTGTYVQEESPEGKSLSKVGVRRWF